LFSVKDAKLTRLCFEDVEVMEQIVINERNRLQPRVKPPIRRGNCSPQVETPPPSA
jgi:hypothetical protein